MRHFAMAGYWGSAQHHRRGPGALLPARRPARAAAQPRLRAPAALVDRVLRSAGASRATPRAPASRTFFKGGWRGTGCGRLVHEAALFEHGRHALRHGGAHGRQPHARLRHRDAARRGRADLRHARERRRAAQAAPRLPRGLRRAGLRDRARDRCPGIRVELGLRRDRATSPAGRLPGYCRPWAYLLRAGGPRPGARSSASSAARGHGLLVLDAYRPARASRALVRWARRSGRGRPRGHLHRPRSRHNLGSAVDLTLVRLRDGRQAADGHGLRRPRAARAHARRERPGAAQPAGAEARDGAPRLQRLLARVVALRAPRARHRHLDLTLGCPRPHPR